jgi:hypothetical protein
MCTQIVDKNYKIVVFWNQTIDEIVQNIILLNNICISMHLLKSWKVCQFLVNMTNQTNPSKHYNKRIKMFSVTWTKKIGKKTASNNTVHMLTTFGRWNVARWMVTDSAW